MRPHLRVIAAHQPPRSIVSIRLELEYFDFLGIDWRGVRLHGLLWAAGTPVTFSGTTYRPTTKGWPMDEIEGAIMVNPRLAHLHGGDGRLPPTHWLLIDALNGTGYILPAEVARASVIDQRAIGWSLPESSFPLADGGTDGP